jgi:hypothetical protein
MHIQKIRTFGRISGYILKDLVVTSHYFVYSETVIADFAGKTNFVNRGEAHESGRFARFTLRIQIFQNVTRNAANVQVLCICIAFDKLYTLLNDWSDIYASICREVVF